MKRCEFCVHHDYTDNLEEVCTKHLVYVGNQKHDFPCKDFCADVKFGTVALAVSVLFLLLIVMIKILC